MHIYIVYQSYIRTRKKGFGFLVAWCRSPRWSLARGERNVTLYLNRVSRSASTCIMHCLCGSICGLVPPAGPQTHIALTGATERRRRTGRLPLHGRSRASRKDLPGYAAPFSRSRQPHSASAQALQNATARDCSARSSRTAPTGRLPLKRATPGHNKGP